MGYLHEGHLTLVRMAGELTDSVVVSIFVNPTQFGPGEDLDRYPRDLDRDVASLEEAGADLVFVPEAPDVYPAGYATVVHVQRMGEKLCGAFRPGHFDGVVTVVARLFNLVYPEIAVFGEKDYQQLLVIQQMVEDLGYPLRILPVATVRESSGLAMSSRNNYLDQGQMKAAVQLNSVLKEAVSRIADAGHDPALVEQEASSKLEQLGFRVDYVAFRRASDLEKPGPGDTELRVLAAAWCGKTRLIDNLPVS